MSRTTVAKWPTRTPTGDTPMGPRDPRSTVLTSTEEAIIVEFRRKGPLPLDDVTSCLRNTISGEFWALWASTGRPSIPEEKLLRPMLLQAFYPIRSECEPMERLDFYLLFRWFVGIRINDPVK